jgi:hypothetical protein
MKCIINGNEVRKVSNEQAAEMVTKGWAYCPKHIWKEQIRDKKEAVAPAVAEKQAEKEEVKGSKTPISKEQSMGRSKGRQVRNRPNKPRPAGKVEEAKETKEVKEAKT